MLQKKIRKMDQKIPPEAGRIEAGPSALGTGGNALLKAVIFFSAHMIHMNLNDWGFGDFVKWLPLDTA